MPDITARENRCKAITAVFVMVGLYAGLVLLSRGDFWPFSVFPMYSRGHEPWSRPVLVDVGAAPASEVWSRVTLDRLPGEVFSMFESGVRRRELREFFNRGPKWDSERILSLRSLLGESNLCGRRLLILEAKGQLHQGGGVRVTVTPLALFTAEGTDVNPAFLPSAAP